MRNLTISWSALGIGLAAFIFLDPSRGSWIGWLALIAYCSHRWQPSILAAEKEISRIVSLIHRSAVVSGCVLAVGLVVIEAVDGKNAPVFGTVWKTGAEIIFGASILADFILFQALRNRG